MSFTCAEIKYRKKPTKIYKISVIIFVLLQRNANGWYLPPRYYFPRRDTDVVAQNGGVARANSRGEREARKQFSKIHSYSPATVKRWAKIRPRFIIRAPELNSRNEDLLRHLVARENAV